MSKQEYEEISIEQMREFLSASKGWVEATLPKSKEYTFQFATKKHPDIIIRVWTSIHVATGKTRKVGRDAIRVCAVNTVTDVGYVKSTRVNRTPGWQDRVKSRVYDVLCAVYDRKARLDAAVEVTMAEAVKETPVEFPTFETKKARLAWFREHLATDVALAYRGLEIVNSFQTADERASGCTVELNGVGWSGVDAEIMTSFAKQYRTKRERYGPDAYLSDGQVNILKNKMPKYARQIIWHLEAQGVLPHVGKAVSK